MVTLGTDLGAEWVADGEGERLDVLLYALSEPVLNGDGCRWTNLKLTGAPIQDFDRERGRRVTVTRLPGASGRKAGEK